MEMCKLSLFFVLVVTVMLSLCDANDTARDERLEELMEMLQQQSEQLNSHSLQNTQIIRHLADIAEQLQVGVAWVQFHQPTQPLTLSPPVPHISGVSFFLSLLCTTF